MEFALPKSWRDAFDLKGFVPSEDTKLAFIDQCERIERNETPINKDRDEKDDDNRNDKKNKFTKSRNNNKKNGNNKPPTTNGPGSFYCKRCGDNATHNTNRCYILNREAKELEQSANGKGNGKSHDKPYSKRSFRKEVNAMARRAGKHDGLDVMATAIKREQKKSARQDKKRASAKAAKAAKKADPDTDSSSDESDKSVHLMENPIPRKKAFKNLRLCSLWRPIHRTMMIQWNMLATKPQLRKKPSFNQSIRTNMIRKSQLTRWMRNPIEKYPWNKMI